MKVLILHNNNLPESIIGIESKQDNEFCSYAVSQASVSEDAYDTFLSRQVNELISPKNQEPLIPDLIVLPFSLSETNPLELTGIRLAAHIRLDERDCALKKAPMLFLGPVSFEDAFRLSPLASFLLTHKVFVSNLHTADALKEWISYNKDRIRPLSEIDYSSFYDAFRVDPPSNYNDSHHSITNRWTILRWNEMFDWKDNPPRLDSTVVDFSNSLYFKWLQGYLGKRAHFKPKHREIAVIPLISGKIVFIDDEINLGWGEIMSRLIQNSKAEFIPYNDFSSTYTRDELVARIEAFIDSVPDADCYILDLRLHEEDHTKEEHIAFSGHRIAQYIYEKNHGAQIVFFTASEKTINYVASEKYFSGYVIKENPDHLYNRGQSKEVFSDFAHALQKACSKAYLRDYYPLCKDISYLDDFFEILRQDDKNEKFHDINMRSAALNLMVFLESSIKERFKMDGTEVVRNLSREKVGDASDLYIRSEPDSNGGKSTPREMTLSNLHPTPRKEWRQVPETDIFLLCAVLSKVIGISTDNVNNVIELKNIRNRSIAHGHGPQKIKLKFLVGIFDNVVQPLFAKLDF